jgi:hypothetical protein
MYWSSLLDFYLLQHIKHANVLWEKPVSYICKNHGTSNTFHKEKDDREWNVNKLPLFTTVRNKGVWQLHENKCWESRHNIDLYIRQPTGIPTIFNPYQLKIHWTRCKSFHRTQFVSGFGTIGSIWSGFSCFITTIRINEPEMVSPN